MPTMTSIPKDKIEHSRQLGPPGNSGGNLHRTAELLGKFDFGSSPMIRCFISIVFSGLEAQPNFQGTVAVIIFGTCPAEPKTLMS
jgi:hypothetical protein